MRRLLRRLIVVEIVIAAHVGAFGDWWARHAGRRLGKLSAKFPRGSQ
jgi:hypothetical protein